MRIPCLSLSFMKIILFSFAAIMCSIVVTTTSTMFIAHDMRIALELNSPSILISKKSSQKLRTIESDYKKLYKAIQSKMDGWLTTTIYSRYNKPSDLIADLCQDKSINTKHMTPNLVFTAEDVTFLNQEFKGLSRQYSTVYAWSTALIIIRKTLKIACDNLKKRELIRSAARVALRQNPAFTEKCRLFDLFDECHNVVFYNLEHLEQEDQGNMLKAIKGYKNILAKNKLDTRQ